jgi:replication initiation and membrane attachment protein DnaB
MEVNGANLLKRILKAFLETKEVALNITQITNMTQCNQREVAGALSVLESLGVLMNIYSRPKTRIYSLQKPLRAKELSDRFSQILTKIFEGK